MRNLKFENKRNIKNAAIVIGLFGTLSFYGFNCAPPSFQVADDGSASLVLSSNGIVPVDDVGTSTLETKTDLPFALLTAEQVFFSMLNVTDQQNFSNAIRDEYAIRSGSFSVIPDLKTVNGPMLLAITSLSGEVCNGLVAREQAIADVSQRKFFGSVNFAQAIANLNAAGYTDVVTKLSNSFLGRAPSSAELTIFNSFRTDFTAAIPAANIGQAAQTRALVLSTCSALLSSFEVFSY